MDHHAEKSLDPKKDRSTPFGQDQRERTVTQDEQSRMTDHDGAHLRGQGRPGARPTSKR